MNPPSSPPPRPLTSFLLLALAVLLRAPLASAQPQIRLALLPGRELDFSRSLTFAALEAELSTRPRIALVERAEIDRVLAEQSLQMALSAEGGAARQRLGSILQAQALALLRAGEKQPGSDPSTRLRYVDVILAETRNGVRVSQERFAWNEADPAASAQALAAGLEEALAAVTQEVKAIVAVPPFVSQDLTFRYGSLQDAYAEILRLALQRRPGVYSVELAEAQAIAKEMELTAAGAFSRSLTPYYFLGRYRNEGSGEARRVTVALSIQHGPATLSEFNFRDLDPASVPQTLQKAAADFLTSQTLGSPSSLYDPRNEFGKLRRQGLEFKRLGEWEKAMGLIEAALLLDPQFSSLRWEAVGACGALADSGFDPAADQPVYVAKAQKALLYSLRGLDHLERALRTEETLNTFRSKDPQERATVGGFVSAFAQKGRDVYEDRMLPPDLKGLVSEIRNGRRETGLRFLESVAGDPVVAPQALSALSPLFYDEESFGPEDPEQATAFKSRFEALRTSIREAASRPSASQPKLPGILGLPTTPEEIQKARTVGNAWRDSLYTAPIAREDGPTTGPGEIRFEPLPGLPFAAEGWMPCGAGVDIIWGKNDVWRMCEPGKPESVVHLNPGLGQFQTPCYDGKCVWFGAKDRAVVFDPAVGKPDWLDKNDGLPRGEVFAAPLGPGVACLAGGFGRGWCATARYDGSGSATVEVFHEARLAEGGDDDPRVAFVPENALPITVSGFSVVVARAHEPTKYLSPLFVDPANKTVEVRHASVPQPYPNTIQQDGFFYSISLEGAWSDERKSHVTLDKISPALRSRRVVMAEMGEYFGLWPIMKMGDLPVPFLVQGNLAVFLPWGCKRPIAFAADIEQGTPVELKGQLPATTRIERHRVGRSNHYGPLYLIAAAGKTRCYRVVLQISPAAAALLATRCKALDQADLPPPGSPMAKRMAQRMADRPTASQPVQPVHFKEPAPVTPIPMRCEGQLLNGVTGAPLADVLVTVPKEVLEGQLRNPSPEFWENVRQFKPPAPGKDEPYQPLPGGLRFLGAARTDSQGRYRLEFIQRGKTFTILPLQEHYLIRQQSVWLVPEQPAPPPPAVPAPATAPAAPLSPPPGGPFKIPEKSEDGVWPIPPILAYPAAAVKILIQTQDPKLHLWPNWDAGDSRNSQRIRDSLSGFFATSGFQLGYVQCNQADAIPIPAQVHLRLQLRQSPTNRTVAHLLVSSDIFAQPGETLDLGARQFPTTIPVTVKAVDSQDHPLERFPVAVRDTTFDSWSTGGTTDAGGAIVFQLMPGAKGVLVGAEYLGHDSSRGFALPEMPFELPASASEPVSLSLRVPDEVVKYHNEARQRSAQRAGPPASPSPSPQR